jgi:hypothetical protein
MKTSRRLLERAYAECLAMAEWCEQREARMSCLAALVAFLVSIAIGATVLDRFPNSGDEYVYLYQADTMAAGRLSNPAPAEPDAFRFNYIARRDNRLYGTFPPGWPLAPALAACLHVPNWAVNPALGGLSLVLLWALGRELYGPRVGPVAAALLASSGFFLFNAASFFSHTFCGLLLLAAAYSATAARAGSTAAPLLTGFLIGWAVLSRYFTGAFCGVAVGVLLAARTGPRHRRALGLMVAGGAPWMVFLLAYNYALSGDPWRLTTTDVTVSYWFAPGFLMRGIDILATQLLSFVLWTPPALIAAYAWALHRQAPPSGRELLDWLFAAMVITLLFYVNRGGNQYGPRFYYESFLFLLPFTAGHLFRRERLADAGWQARYVFATLVVSILISPLLIVVHASQVRNVITERSDVFSRVKDAGVTDAIVLLSGRVGTARSMDVRDLTRNGISYSAPVLYALDRSEAENCALAQAYPRRTLYRYSWDAIERRGRLTAYVVSDSRGVCE